MSRRLIEKLMRIANDPSATPEERASYLAKANALKGKPITVRPLLDLMRAGIFDGPEFDEALAIQVSRSWPTTYATGKPVSCCCKGAGLSGEECRIRSGNKTVCRCACHPRKERKGGRPKKSAAKGE